MCFRGAAMVDVVDPVFSKDLSFYLLTLPFYDDLIEIIIALLCLTIALWLIAGLVLFHDGRAFSNRVDSGPNAYAPASIIVLWPTSGSGLTALASADRM